MTSSNDPRGINLGEGLCEGAAAPVFGDGEDGTGGIVAGCVLSTRAGCARSTEPAEAAALAPEEFEVGDNMAGIVAIKGKQTVNYTIPE